MKKLVDFGEYVKEKIEFPQGGDIGGNHKKKISDEEFEKNPSVKGITSNAYTVEREKNEERKINLMGDLLKNYNDQYTVNALIGAVNDYNPKFPNYSTDQIRNYMNNLPQSIKNHFDIVSSTKEDVDDFIENKFELFKRSYDMFKEIDKKYPGERYGR